LDKPIPPEWGRGIVCSSASRVRGGTGNFCAGNALTPNNNDRCIQIRCMETGAFVDEVGADIMIFGKVWIGNITTSSAIYSALCKAEGGAWDPCEGPEHLQPAMGSMKTRSLGRRCP
jgi:hypothetical protein